MTPTANQFAGCLFELLLVTAVFAAVLGILRYVGINGLWGQFGIFIVYGCYLFGVLGRLRRKLIENDLWYPNPGQTEDDSIAEER